MSTAGIANDQGFTYGFATTGSVGAIAAMVSRCKLSKGYTLSCSGEESVSSKELQARASEGGSKENIQTAKNKNLFIMS